MTKLFRYVAFLEGLSYLALFANMFIVKNYDIELYKSILKPLGMTHGLLFIAYVYLAFMIREKQAWSWFDLVLVQLASLLPFGTFMMEKKYF
jgi:integral membrane protein